MIGGVLTDKVGTRKVIAGSCVLTAVTVYPLFTLLNEPTVLKAIFVQAGLVVTTVGLHCAVPRFLTTMFPVNERYSGIAFSHSLGMAIFGGTTSYIVTYIVVKTGIATMPALYVMFTCAIGFGAITWASAILNNFKRRKFETTALPAST